MSTKDAAAQAAQEIRRVMDVAEHASGPQASQVREVGIQLALAKEELKRAQELESMWDAASTAARLRAESRVNALQSQFDRVQNVNEISARLLAENQAAQALANVDPDAAHAAALDANEAGASRR